MGYKVEGMDELLKKITWAKTEIQQRADRIITATGSKIAREAKHNLRPQLKNNRGGLMGMIKMNYLKPLAVEIIANRTYAPYVEFGTGKKVKVPKGLEAYAMQFKGRGIRKVNLPARPYLFPAFFSNIELLKTKLKDITR